MAEYITKKTVLTIVALHYSISKNTCCRQLCDALFRQIKEEPAADVRPVVRARWNTVKYPLYECSNCGAVYQDVGYGFNYCPSCGADMRGEDDG